ADPLAGHGDERADLSGPRRQRSAGLRQVLGVAVIEVAHGAGRALDPVLADLPGDVAPDLALVAQVHAELAQRGADAGGLPGARRGEQRRVAGVEALAPVAPAALLDARHGDAQRRVRGDEPGRVEDAVLLGANQADATTRAMRLHLRHATQTAPAVARVRRADAPWLSTCPQGNLSAGARRRPGRAADARSAMVSSDTGMIASAIVAAGFDADGHSTADPRVTTDVTPSA